MTAKIKKIELRKLGTRRRVVAMVKRLVAFTVVAFLVAAIVYGVKWLGHKNYDFARACIESGGEVVYVARIQRCRRDGQWVEVSSSSGSIPK